MFRIAALSLVVALAMAVAAADSAHAAPMPSVAAHSASSLGWGIGVSVGGPARIHPHRATTVSYVQEPIYSTVLVGYDVYGTPIYNTVVVGYRTVPIYQQVVYPHVHRPAWNLGFGYWNR